MNAKLTPTSLHQRLASSSRDRHQALDQHPSLKRLLSPGMSLTEYVQVLCLLRQCFSLIEPALASFEKSGLHPGFSPYTCKVPALDHDLQQLGVNAQEDSSISPICVDSIGSYLGARYVLEGSSQGGIFIASRLEKTLPELCDKAFSFWHLQRHAAEHWSAFLAMLAQLDGDSREAQQALRSTIQTFDVFLGVFSKVIHDRSD
ncbi:MAG: biliverdin-producing heme oxygenase [Gammaproteobacteria bacterium]|nr:biliverdin-producing heme oxygenase [Gammaproteobacteria bacterium]MDP2142316.1 biliverdin-producing heme oxygenase [Gammaproteobacteria bacterium]MDP2348557.1 biliverdin-producing heme oxygenase [Gammaproteobacteria bacterium]